MAPEQTHEPTVIVVEQIPAMREVLKATLEEGFRCQVLDLPSVKNLLETVKQRRPVFILLDIELPGVERFLIELRDDPHLEEIPIIGADLTGTLTDREVLRAGYDANITGDLLSLEHVAWRYLAERQAAQASG